MHAELKTIRYDMLAAYSGERAMAVASSLTVRYLGIEVEDALEIAEQTEV